MGKVINIRLKSRGDPKGSNTTPSDQNAEIIFIPDNIDNWLREKIAYLEPRLSQNNSWDPTNAVTLTYAINKLRRNIRVIDDDLVTASLSETNDDSQKEADLWEILIQKQWSSPIRSFSLQDYQGTKDLFIKSDQTLHEPLFNAFLLGLKMFRLQEERNIKAQKRAEQEKREKGEREKRKFAMRQRSLAIREKENQEKLEKQDLELGLRKGVWRRLFNWCKELFIPKWKKI